jgi:hypothetical protein
VRRSDFERFELQSPRAQSAAKDKDWQKLYDLMCSLCSTAGVDVSKAGGTHPYVGIWSFMMGVGPSDFDRFAMWLNSRSPNTAGPEEKKSSAGPEEGKSDDHADGK